MTPKKFLYSESRKITPFRPVFFNLGKEKDLIALKRLISRGSILRVSDDYEEQLREYFAIKHPKIALNRAVLNAKCAAYIQKLAVKKPLWRQGRWVYFLWSGALTHILEEAAFYAVRTARNRELITPDEQKKFYNAVIGIAGLSVGNSIALALVLQGGARHIKLADHDQLTLSNLNRIRSGVGELGACKTEMTARQIYELNPYAKIELFSDGLTKKNIKGFFSGGKKLDIVIDEIDNLAVKYLIREEARKHRIAIVMGADNGDSAVVDVERYDLDAKTPFFHGRMGEVSYDAFMGLDKMGIGRMITKHIGPENVSERMLGSLMAIGKTIVSWPQLGGAALMNGSAVAYAVRRILTGQSIEENRAIISLDEKLDPEHKTPTHRAAQKKAAVSLRKVFGI
ncbi:MAG: ThiF family adenylyltransferase [bacterium]|nr:ThiF family adenylyltransferase [bacterium]